jgi:hypothetical protein
LKEPFVRKGDRVEVRLEDDARTMLASLPDLIAASGDAGGRLDYRAHPTDPDAERHYRELLGDSLEEGRERDRATVTMSAAARSIELEEAESWMRVIGEARLVLAARLGIVSDGWEETADPEGNPEMALLTYLGFLQDRLVQVLMPSA